MCVLSFPNFSRWMDEASLALFMACGVPPWRELLKTRGIIGTPLLEIHTKFKRPATCGETIQVHICIRGPANPERIKAIPVPPDIIHLCS